MDKCFCWSSWDVRGKEEEWIGATRWENAVGETKERFMSSSPRLSLIAPDKHEIEDEGGRSSSVYFLRFPL